MRNEVQFCRERKLSQFPMTIFLTRFKHVARRLAHNDCKSASRGHARIAPIRVKNTPIAVSTKSFSSSSMGWVLQLLTPHFRACLFQQLLNPYFPSSRFPSFSSLGPNWFLQLLTVDFHSSLSGPDWVL